MHKTGDRLIFSRLPNEVAKVVERSTTTTTTANRIEQISPSLDLKSQPFLVVVVSSVSFFIVIIIG